MRYLITIPIESDMDPSSILDEAIVVAEDLANRVEGTTDEDEVCVSDAK